MTTPGEQGIRAARWDAVAKDRRIAAFDGAREGMGGPDRLIYFGEMLAALDEHLNEAAKEARGMKLDDHTVRSMYGGKIRGISKLEKEATK